MYLLLEIIGFWLLAGVVTIGLLNGAKAIVSR